MTYVPSQRPPGAGTGESRVADIAAAQLLMDSLRDLNEPVPPWVALLANGIIDDEHGTDLLSAVQQLVVQPTSLPPTRRWGWRLRRYVDEKRMRAVDPNPDAPRLDVLEALAALLKAEKAAAEPTPPLPDADASDPPSHYIRLPDEEAIRGRERQ